MDFICTVSFSGGKVRPFQLRNTRSMSPEAYCINTHKHYDDVTMSRMASLITSLTIVYSTVYSGADQRKHQSPASLAFVRRIHRGPVNSPHKWPVTRKRFPFDDVIMDSEMFHKTTYIITFHIIPRQCEECDLHLNARDLSRYKIWWLHYCWK